MTIFEVLAEPHRRQILRTLLDGERPAGALVETLDLAQPTVSKHLKVLREAGLVDDRKQGRWNFYSLRADVLDEMSAYLQERKPDENAWAACACGDPHPGQCCD